MTKVNIETTATPLFVFEADEANIPIYCKCGGEVFLDPRLFQLWINNGVKFRCPKCNCFIVSK